MSCVRISSVNVAMAASVRRIVRGKQISDNLAGRSSVFQSGREGGAPSYLAKPKMEGNWRRGDGGDGQTYSKGKRSQVLNTCIHSWDTELSISINEKIVMALLILLCGGQKKTSKKIKCSRI